MNGVGAVLTYTFSGLNRGNRYNLAASAVRAGGFQDRWSLFQLDGAGSFTSAHTPNALTTLQVASIAANEVVINTGINDTPESGDMAQWLNIDPGNDGMFSLNSSQYLGVIPGGSSGGAKGYGVTGFRLEEVVVPEPSSLWVLILGFGVWCARRLRSPR